MTTPFWYPWFMPMRELWFDCRFDWFWLVLLGPVLLEPVVIC